MTVEHPALHYRVVTPTTTTTTTASWTLSLLTPQSISPYQTHHTKGRTRYYKTNPYSVEGNNTKRPGEGLVVEAVLAPMKPIILQLGGLASATLEKDPHTQEQATDLSVGTVHTHS